METPRSVARLGLCLFALLFVASVSFATDFYVSPTASASGTGSFTSPWRLQDALDQPSSVHPGDTIWLRGGTYAGTFVSYLNGTAASAIVVRQYTGERATIDGGSSGTANLSVRGSYTWFWGFEIKNSDTHRQSTQPGSNPSDIHRGDGVQIWQTATEPGLKFINLVIHDTRQGVSFWQEATDAELNGCLIYYNGWNGSDRGHGHGIYTQNQTGTKHIVDNVVFTNFDHGIQAYGSSSAHIDNYDVQGNTFIGNGLLANPPGGRNLLIGGDSTAQNLSIANNFLYYTSADSPDTAFQLGYGAGCSNTTVTGNYVSNNTYFTGGCLPTSMTGNTFYGAATGFTHSSYPSNTYTTSRPTGVQVFVRPSAYEAGRANITVFNWPNQSTVSVNLTGILANGEAYEIRNAQDFFGAPVLSGTYAGGSVTIPMTGLSVATPVGWAAPTPTGPEFNAFVLLPVLGAPAPTATRTPTPTPGAPTATRTRTPTPGGPSATPTRTPTPGSGALPAGWQQQDIGSPGLAGSATYSAAAFTVNASGTDIEGASDKFHYVDEPLSGDGTIVARVSSLENTDSWAKAGVMIRESLAANSRQAMMVLTPGNGLAFQRRLSTGGPTVNTGGALVAAPYWVKLVRSGNTFTGYASSNGTSWTQVGSDTIAMAANVYVGLALTAHNDSTLCTAVIDNVTAPSAGDLTLRIEAESPTVTAPMVAVSDSTAFGGHYIKTSTADSGTGAWTFSVPSSGTYYVWGRVRADSGAHDSFYVKMDSGTEDIYDVVQSWSTSWQWTRLNGRGGTSQPRTINPRTFSLTAGSHTLTFRGREVETWLDRVIITTNSYFTPTEAP